MPKNAPKGKPIITKAVKNTKFEPFPQFASNRRPQIVKRHAKNRLKGCPSLSEMEPAANLPIVLISERNATALVANDTLKPIWLVAISEKIIIPVIAPQRRSVIMSQKSVVRTVWVQFNYRPPKLCP